MSDIHSLSLVELKALVAEDAAWRDSVAAISRVHHVLSDGDTDWTQMLTAGFLGIGGPDVSMALRVARDLNHPKIAAAPTLFAAYTILLRLDRKGEEKALAQIAETANVWERAGYHPPKVRPPAEESVLKENFLSWAPNYRGEKFDFIHCDFGDDYYDLFECLTLHLDNLMAPAGHIMFWVHPSYVGGLLEYFSEAAPSLFVDEVPLVWLKSDLAGTSPNPALFPRRVYETALLATRQDRPLVRTLANAYASPSNTKFHPEAKPEPMLKHFFRMIVNSGTRMLDPTCGAGSALCAAESLGAEFVLGMDVESNSVGFARDALRKTRTMRSLPFAD